MSSGTLQGHARIGHISNPADTQLYGRNAQQRVYLLSRVAELCQVIDCLQHRFSSGHGAIIESLLLTPEVKADEGQVPVAKLRLDGTRLKHGCANIVFRGSTLNQIQPHPSDPVHLDSIPSGLAVAFSKVQVPH